MAFCRIVPLVNGKDSKFFNDVLKASNNNREVARYLWGLTLSPGYMQRLENIEYDTNGEPTLLSFLKASLLYDGINRSKIEFYHELREFGALNKDGSRHTWDYIEDIADKIQQFNDSHDDVAALPIDTPDGVTVEMYDKNSVLQEVEQFKYNNQLHHQLEGMLNGIGFAVSRDDNLSSRGIFDPRHAETTADGLLVAIRIAKGKLGRLAFFEEFSHLAIAGLKHTELVQRIFKLLDNDEFLHAIYGDDYDSYDERYKHNRDRLIEEAAGKILLEYITSNESYVSTEMLIDRLYNTIKLHVSLLTEDSIFNMIDDLKANFKSLSLQILDKSILSQLDINAIKNSPEFYSLLDSVEERQKLLELQLLSINELINMYKRRHLLIPENAPDLLAFSLLKVNQETQLTLVGFNGYLGYIGDKIKFFRKQFMDIAQQSQLSLDAKIGFTQMEQLCDLTNDMIDFYKASKNIIGQMADIRFANVEQLLQKENFGAWNQIKQALPKFDNLLEEFKNDIDKNNYVLTFKLIYDFWGLSSLRQITLGRHKGEIESIAAIMEAAPLDATWINSHVVSLGESTDELARVIYGITRSKLNERDEILNKLASELRAWHRILIDSGSGSDFIYEVLKYKDKKGNERQSVNIISDIDWQKFYEARREFRESIKNLPWAERQSKYLRWLKENCYYRWVSDDGNPGLPSKLIIHDEHAIDTDDTTIKMDSNIEWIPKHHKGDKYYRANSPLERLTETLRNYYDAMIRMKQVAESFLPTYHIRTYRPINITNDAVEIVELNIGNPGLLVKTLWDRAKDSVVRRIDNTEYGSPDLHDLDSDETINDESVQEKQDNAHKKFVRLNAAGEVDSGIPILYINNLHDPSRLSKDFTSSMMAYIAACVNYGKMSEVAGRVKLLRLYAHDRPVKRMVGSDSLVGRTRSFAGVKYADREVTIPGSESNIYAAIDLFWKSEYLGQRKAEEKVSLKLNDTQEVNIDYGMIGDSMMRFITMLHMGLNEFAGINNDLIGRFLMLLESRGHGFYDTKNLMRAEKRYFLDLFQYLANLNETNYNDIMHLLIDKFNVLDDFYEDLKRKGYYQGTVAKVIGNSSLLVFNNMGEHHMHVTSFYAVLDSIKVKIDGKEATMLDAFEVVSKEIKDITGTKVLGQSYEVLVKPNVTDMNGNVILTDGAIRYIHGAYDPNDKATRFSDNRINKSIYNQHLGNWIRAATRRVNQKLFGAYPPIDRGAGSKSVWFRAVMQFRQWMPEHFERRWGVARHDSELGIDYEGFYRCFGVFLWNVFQDLKKGQLHIRTSFEQLSDLEKGYIKLALDEILALMMLITSTMLIRKQHAKHKDDDEPTFLRPFGAKELADMTFAEKAFLRFQRQTYLQLLRLKSDVGIAAPWITMWDSFLEFFKNPAAITQEAAAIEDLFNIFFMFEEVGSGSHKGENKWWYKAKQQLPALKNLEKTWDFIEDNTSFNHYAA